MKDYQIVFVTAPDRETARHLVQCAIQGRLAACGKIFPNVESHYWWDGKMECSSEFQIIFKTHLDRMEALKALIMKEHPYDTPEFVAIPIESGIDKYLTWIKQETKIQD